MAQVQYQDAPTVAPEQTERVSRVQHIQANPTAFGGGMAQGLERLGAGATRASQFFSEVVADDQTNALFERWNKRLYGDPNQMVPGPDGTMQPDTGYMGLKGRTALDRRPQLEKEMDDDLKEIRRNLTTPQQQAKFDDQSRRYRQRIQERVGSHAEGQFGVYAGHVNTAAAQVALTGIANDWNDETAFVRHADDLLTARIKDAQIKGITDPQSIQAVTIKARSDALKARLDAMAVTEPARAYKELTKFQKVAGLQYDEMARSYRSRAEEQTGNSAAQQKWAETYVQQPGGAQIQPVLDQAGDRYGVSGDYLYRTFLIESGGNLNPKDSSTGAQGPFQFVPSTAKRFGLTNPKDFKASADAAARLAVANRDALEARLGRPPTDAELYLAHQQGADGASKLLANPTMRAGDLVGDKAISVNGGDPNAAASQFTQMWTARFAGSAAGVISAKRKAQAYNAIMADPSLNDSERNHALRWISTTAAAERIAMDENEKAQKQAADQAADRYVQLMHGGGDISGLADMIRNDPALQGEWRTREALMNMAEKSADEGAAAATKHYGSGYWDAYKRITARDDDASRITDPVDIYRMAGPGGGLTVAGADKLAQTLRAMKKDVNTASVHQAKAGLLKGIQSQMAKEQFIPGMGSITTNKKGMEAFEMRFVPRLEAEYDAWVSQKGKNPWEFLTKEKFEQIANEVYPPSQRKIDAMQDSGEGLTEDKNAPPPPAPRGIEPKNWTPLVTAPPLTNKGTPLSKAMWAQKLTMLVNNPSPENIKLFNESQFGRKAGMDGQRIIDQLNGRKPEAAPGKPWLSIVPQTLLPPHLRETPEAALPPGQWQP